jgi:mRNA interferase MazF
VVIRRGEIWWASLPDPAGSGPGFRRPLVVVSANSFNDSRINTVIAAVVTSNLRLGDAPGNVRLPAMGGLGLSKASVANVSQLVTVDKSFLKKRVGRLTPQLQRALDEGLRLVLSL